MMLISQILLLLPQSSITLLGLKHKYLKNKHPKFETTQEEGMKIVHHIVDILLGQGTRPLTFIDMSQTKENDHSGNKKPKKQIPSLIDLE
jgi:hypothetical protein